MRIVHVITRLLRAGSEENTIETCIWQAERGHDVFVIHGPNPDKHWASRYGDRIKFIEVQSLVHRIELNKDFAAFKCLKHLFRDINPDIIHTHQTKAGVIGRLSSIAVTRAVVVHGIHIIPFEGVTLHKKILYILIEKFVAKYTDVFIAVSNAVGEEYRARGICRNYEVVYSGMDLEIFRSAEPPSDWPQILGLESTASVRPTVVLMLAAFEQRKRHIEFLVEFAKVCYQVPEVKILLAGAGPNECKVRAVATKLGLSDRVIFCGHRSDPQALIALADICILTSEREGLPRVVVQYVASGKPVIVTKLPGIDEIVTQGLNGIITHPINMKDTADRLVGLLRNKSEIERLSLGSYSYDTSNWELNRLGARTTEIYLKHRSKKLSDRYTK